MRTSTASALRPRLAPSRLRAQHTKAAVRELDRLAREAVFARDRHQCMRCGKGTRLQCCHVYSRRYRALRWNLLNLMTLCAGCHLWWHHRPLDAMKWWREKVLDRQARLLELAACTRNPKRPDLEAIRAYLTATSCS